MTPDLAGMAPELESAYAQSMSFICQLMMGNADGWHYLSIRRVPGRRQQYIPELQPWGSYLQRIIAVCQLWRQR